MNIYIPYKLYVALPWACMVIASISVALPASTVKWSCIVALYAYSVYVIHQRMIHTSAY